MLTLELQHTIDERWDACWPISKLRPIVILDLVSYLFFVRKTSSELQYNEEFVAKPGFFLQSTKGREEMKGDFFSDPEDQNFYSLFASENGIAELEKEYSQHAAYGSFFKSGLIMLPTPKLLENALGIIKIIEAADDDIKGSIFEYLLGKTELVDPNGHAYLPEYLVELLVALSQPGENDFILDPSSGNGSLLVGCTKYINGKNLKSLNKKTDKFDSQKLKGMESDITSRRIAAMNLMLHGINKPELKVLDIFSPLNSITNEDATVIIANLIFLPGENNRNVESNTGGDVIRKEIYYLDFILKNFMNGASCVVIVPDIILYQVGTEFVAIRQELIENYKLDAVISVEDRQFRLFNGAGILVFSKEISSSTDKVWFYKLKPGDGGFSPNLNSHNADNLSMRTDDIANVLEHFRNKGKVKESGKGFYIHADEIRAKNYNFSYNEYNSLMKPKPLGVHTIAIKSIDLPKWETQSVNEATSLLQPMSKVRSGLIIDKASVKSLNWQKSLDLARKAFPSKVRATLTIVKANVKSPDWRKLFDLTRKPFKSKVTSRLTIYKANVKSLDWRQSFDRSRKTFLSKKTVSKKNLYRAVFLILLFGIGYLFWFLLLQHDTVTKNKASVVTSIISDSIKRSPKFSASLLYSLDSVVKTINGDLSKDSIGNNKTSFKVISKAYFYSSPALGSPEDVYITNINNDTLTPIKEENGFVYVDYINSQGKSTKGWLNTNDLEATTSSAIDGDINKKRNQDLSEDANDKITKYVIKTKAYFYLSPDISTRIDLYLAKPNHIRLIPLKEENGFVYVVYTNTKGKNTTGWLSKKDLEPVKK